MKTARAIPYLAPYGLARPIPLERFLPECPVNVISRYFAGDSRSAEWVFDPFGSNPLLGLEAAGSGKKVLVACNNPILFFLFKMLAQPATKEAYLAVLSSLASQTRGSERLETHIKNVYLTRCVVCHTLIQADGYLWKRNETAPYARVYHCRHCGDGGERAITEEDLTIFQPLQRGESIHRARALSRVLMGSEEDRPAVEEALKVYNSRALYVLFTLLNKLEGMGLDAESKDLAEAMMISLLDAGTALWSWPELADQPRQLTLPEIYFEKNLWSELERCVDLWSQPVQPIELTLWPRQPVGAGICLFSGPVRAIEKLPDGMKIDRLICLPPRPNQAFWTLSALWSAWLWGRDKTAHSFSQVLGRRRFDWHWHTLALQQAFKKAVALVPKLSEVFTEIGEPSTGMVFAVCAASHLAGLQLDGLAMRGADATIQMEWHIRSDAILGGKANPQSVGRQAIRSVLADLGEPAPYLTLYTAVVSALTINDAWPATLREFSQEKSSDLQGVITALFNENGFLQRYEATSQELESGKWGLHNWQNVQAPLADRLEETLVELLKSRNTIPAEQISAALNEKFPGFLTPPADLVEFCLTSYAEWNVTTSIWTLRAKEEMRNRQEDLEKARQTLLSLGKKLHYESVDSLPLVWKDKNGAAYQFYLSDLASVSRFFQPDDEEKTQSVLVLPGSRAALLKFKLMRDPHLRELTAHGWHFLKLRALQVLGLRTDLSRTVWEMQLDSDPIDLEETTQLRIFG